MLALTALIGVLGGDFIATLTDHGGAVVIPTEGAAAATAGAILIAPRAVVTSFPAALLQYFVEIGSASLSEIGR